MLSRRAAQLQVRQPMLRPFLRSTQFNWTSWWPVLPRSSCGRHNINDWLHQWDRECPLRCIVPPPRDPVSRPLCLPAVARLAHLQGAPPCTCSPQCWRHLPPQHGVPVPFARKRLAPPPSQQWHHELHHTERKQNQMTKNRSDSQPPPQRDAPGSTPDAIHQPSRSRLPIARDLTPCRTTAVASRCALPAFTVH